MHFKKGVVDIQFNWIFILIAGAILLLLFSNVIIKQKNISDTSANALMLKNLDSILSGYETSAGTANVINMPKTKIEFGCNIYSIGKASKQLNAMNIFAPLVLEGDNIILATFDWSVPYKVTNFIYSTNQEIRYVFIGNSQFANDMYNMIPDYVNKDIYMQVQDLEDKNDEKVRIIFFDQDPIFPYNLKTKSVTALKIKNDEDKGEVEFFNLKNSIFESVGISYYLKKPALLGAIFTDNIENYECVMDSAFNKLNVVSQVYQKKAIELKNSQPSFCGYDYSPINNIFYASDTFNQPSINEIDIAAKSLEEQNKVLQKNSCALIY